MFIDLLHIDTASTQPMGVISNIHNRKVNPDGIPFEQTESLLFAKI